MYYLKLESPLFLYEIRQIVKHCLLPTFRDPCVCLGDLVKNFIYSASIYRESPCHTLFWAVNNIKILPSQSLHSMGEIGTKQMKVFIALENENCYREILIREEAGWVGGK